MISAPNSPYLINFLRYYSVFMALAIFVGCLISYHFGKKYFKDKINSEILLDLFPVLIISGIIGARIYYCVMNFGYFSHNLIEIIKIQNGGISIHGAILGGILGGFIYSKMKQINILPYADVVSFGLILAQGIGRIGNYFNQEAFGMPYNGFLKLYVETAHRPLIYKEYQYFHPTFLYEIIWNLIVFVILYALLKKNKNLKSGTFFFIYAIFYSIGRFIIEGFRIDSVLNVMNIPIAQIVSVLIITISLVCLKFIYKGGAS